MKIKFAVFLLFICHILNAQSDNEYKEQYRPQVHFSPPAHWMNDPNGMVYYKGVYHLFYQYYPDSTVWGPMHWGHATTTDLVHWQNQPVALYPDSSGYIFSGSAVLDENNTSGFGKNGKAPLVAIYTIHNMEAEKARRNDVEQQALAYSLDDGMTWTKYSGNPVIPNSTMRDFRDPKVSWYAPAKKWVMILAVKDHISFYSSPDLKSWKKESDFGNNVGAHGGVWECPDIFPLMHNGKQVWVATVSIGNGAPNGGSGTQYFTGSFNGTTFTANDTTTKWMDYGTDNYAGVTWSNTGNRVISLGWMSNWKYATKVPTTTWRSANTMPRELALKEVNGKLYLTSMPVKETEKIEEPVSAEKNVSAADKTFSIAGASSYILAMSGDNLKDIQLKFTNEKGEELTAGFDSASNNYFIDRTRAGVSDFNPDFAAKATAPRIASDKRFNLTLIMDASSIELFTDNGLSVMTSVFFPETLLNKVQITSSDSLQLQDLIVKKLKPIW